MKVFCFLTYFDGRFVWDLDYIVGKFKLVKSKTGMTFDNGKVLRDLKSAIALWLEDNGQYSFAHRSLQEYFAAMFVCELTDAEKVRMYGKIVEGAITRKVGREFSNFMSLLGEMDPVDYRRLYLVPILEGLREKIKGRKDHVARRIIRDTIKDVELSQHMRGNSRRGNRVGNQIPVAVMGLRPRHEFSPLENIERHVRRLWSVLFTYVDSRANEIGYKI